MLNMFIVFDLDGTLSDPAHRQPLLDHDPVPWDDFYAACAQDAPIWHMIELYRTLHKAGHQLEIWTGRADSVEAETRGWLAFYGIHLPVLRMRPYGDHSPDHILKPSWLRHYAKLPDLIFEDRASVVAAYRARRLNVAQIAEGNF